MPQHQGVFCQGRFVWVKQSNASAVFYHCMPSLPYIAMSTGTENHIKQDEPQVFKTILKSSSFWEHVIREAIEIKLDLPCSLQALNQNGGVTVEF